MSFLGLLVVVYTGNACFTGAIDIGNRCFSSKMDIGEAPKLLNNSSNIWKIWNRFWACLLRPGKCSMKKKSHQKSSWNCSLMSGYMYIFYDWLIIRHDVLLSLSSLYVQYIHGIDHCPKLFKLKSVQNLGLTRGTPGFGPMKLLKFGFCTRKRKRKVFVN
jgi:hypothetical protein